ncbi:MAG: hypothetical protein ACUVWP_06820 [bacterium]
MPKAVIIYVRGLGFSTLQWVLKNTRNSYINEIVNIGKVSKITPYLPLDHWVNELAFLRGENPGDFGYSGWTKWNWNLMEPQRAGIKIISRLFSKDIVAPTIYPLKKLNHTFYTIGFEETFMPDAIKIDGVSVPSVAFQNGFNEPVLFTTQQDTCEMTELGRVVPIVIAENNVDVKLDGMMGTKAIISFEILEEEEAVIIKTGKNLTRIKVGVVSKPIKVVFRNRFFTIISGYYQFYLRSITPHLKIFASPLSIDLRHQFLGHARPRRTFSLLEKDSSPVILRNSYSTAKAYRKGWIDRKSFIKMLEWDIRGITQISTRVASSEDNDIIIISYPYIDITHHYLGSEAILWAFRELDWLIGWFMHLYGIRPYIIGDFLLSELNKVIDLNRYFISTGILKLRDIEKVPYIGLRNQWRHIDYDRTLAFSLGGGRVFINRKNQNFKEGLVKRDFEDKVMNTILRINRIYGGAVKREIKKSDLYSGDYFDEMPDIIVCFGGGLGNSYLDSFTINNKILTDSNDVRYEHLSFDNDKSGGVFISPVRDIPDVNKEDRIIDVIDRIKE